MKGNQLMPTQSKIKTILTASVFAPILLLVLVGACGKNKKSSAELVAAAPIQSSGDGILQSDDATPGLAYCESEDEKAEEDEDEEKEDKEDSADDEASLKGKDKASGKVKKDCPTTAPAGTATPSTAGASLAEGQKIYTANCQGCHGALPGEEQGASGAAILAASSVGPHKSITPWPAGAASTLSAQAAAESLSMAMK